MPVIKELPVHPGQAKDIEALMLRVLQAISGKPIFLCEMALLHAYCAVAPGVQEMPEATRAKRAALIVSAGARAMCDEMVRVAKLDDETVRTLFASKSPSCH